MARFSSAGSVIDALETELRTGEINIQYAILNLKLAEEHEKTSSLKAEKYLKKGEIWALKSNNKDILAQVYQASIDFYGHQKRYKEAYKYEKLYISVHDSLNKRKLKFGCKSSRKQIQSSKK